jgi:hypothetical protein
MHIYISVAIQLGRIEERLASLNIAIAIMVPEALSIRSFIRRREKQSD